MASLQSTGCIVPPAVVQMTVIFDETDTGGNVRYDVGNRLNLGQPVTIPAGTMIWVQQKRNASGTVLTGIHDAIVGWGSDDSVPQDIEGAKQRIGTRVGYPLAAPTVLRPERNKRYSIAVVVRCVVGHT